MTDYRLNLQRDDVPTIVALLPMKGNSERVPNKNMKYFAGNPLYRAIMDELQNCKHVSRVLINTDSMIIKNDVMHNYSDFAVIVDRPEELCGDYVSMNDLIKHDIDFFDEVHFLQTHSTNPLLKSQTIDEAILEYFAGLDRFDSLFSVTKIQTRLYDKKGRAVNHNPDRLIRTQDLEPIYEENSNLYIFSKDSFRRAGNKRIGSCPQMFEMNKLEAIDIDEPEDFELAELLYKKRRCLL